MHVRKQRSFLLRTAVQRLYCSLPGPWDNFLFKTGAPREGSYPEIECPEQVME